jgi:SAM-dependent methyltransferase
VSNAIWHDLECGSYTADLMFWRALAERVGGPVLDVGAGTGRTTLELAREGHEVVAIDRDDELLGQLRERAVGLEVTTIVADARAFWLGDTFPLIIVPMQTIQLLGGLEGRTAFLRCAHRHLAPGGVLAAAIAEVLDLYEVVDGAPAPLPDLREEDGVVYSSQPIAVRADHAGFVLERRREMVDPTGERTVEQDVIRLDRLTARGLEREGTAAGFTPAGRASVAPTIDYSGSNVVILRA